MSPPPRSADLAYWSVIGLAVLSATVRPVVSLLGLPSALLNIDALVTPVACGLVVLAAFTAWRSVTRLQQLATTGVVLLGAVTVASWLVADDRSWASLALGMSVLLLLPGVLYLATMATSRPAGGTERTVLMALVLLQLVVGIVQYVVLDVAPRAPKGADLVDGTTSNNFWPVFALPAAAALALTARDRYRLLWPVPVILLAVYAEAKAALVVFVPLIVVLLVWAELPFIPATRRRLAQLRWRDVPLDALAGRGLIAATVALLVIGVWWTPSIQATWSVFGGHTRTLQDFATTGESGDATQPTLVDAADVVSAEVTESPTAVVLGLGPANTASHAAEILAQGAKSGVDLPPPGPVAQALLPEADVIEFRDAQSTLLGVWGDLGVLGALLYLLVCAGTTVSLSRSAAAGGSGRSTVWCIPAIVAGLFVGGALLDWPEQASIVLPTALVLLVLATSAPGGRPTVDA